jgi:hypothetical protein
MARKKALSEATDEELLRELARRNAEKHFREGMTLSEMELTVESMVHGHREPSIALMLSRMKPEKPTAKACPRCGQRTPVKVRDRERTVRSLSGPVTFKRNYHYCEACKAGFYPVDRLLDLPEEGELSAELEKRVLDFALNDVYGECAARWGLHYPDTISENLLRRVIDRVGRQCEAADQGRLQSELKRPSSSPADILVVEVDGSQLPIRGAEPWKEAKVGLTYRHDIDAHAPVKGSARYVALVGGQSDFAPLLEEALHIERVDEVPTVVWLGDGAPSNWNLADQLSPDALQILDWHHAVQHAVDCGKVLLGEESPWLSTWQARAEALLAAGDIDATVAELMACLPLAQKRRGNDRVDCLTALDDLVRYYRNNAHRMKYRLFREHHFPIGSGAVESAHRHVLQTRMKRAGQHWAMRNARRMARLRAAYRTAGAIAVHGAIRRARRDTLSRGPIQRPRRTFRYARQGERDLAAAARAASN